MLFRNQRDRTNREEVIMLLTPHIIKDDAAVDRLSKEELRLADQLRVGNRKGMMPWGRQRMAESEYEKALAEYNKPKAKNQKVLWHLNAALNLNPKFSEAMALKQQVSGKVISTSESGNVRGLVTRMILNDRVGGPAAPPAPRTEETKPAIPSIPQASTQEPSNPAGQEPTGQKPQADPLAETDWSEEVPLDEVMPENTPGTPEVTPEPTPQPAPGTEPSSDVKWPTPDNVANKGEEGRQ
jgi:hypothetical protein